MSDTENDKWGDPDTELATITDIIGLRMGPKAPANSTGPILGAFHWTAKDGSIHVAYQGNNGEPVHITSDDGGETWVRESGETTISRSKDGGKTWKS